MAKDLVIVESPAKAKTISRFLSKNFVVRASMGHVRDLPKSKMGVDIEHDFKPEYLISPDKKKTIAELKSFIDKDTNIWVATDEDREGEAIGWHLLEALKINPKKNKVERIVFHEITEKAILEAIKHPRQLFQDMIDAQQARRVLDRLVGYELSPLLWKKVRYGLSAGRVQSVATRLVVDREREILAFVPNEYWSLTADFLTKRDEKFRAALTKINGKEAKVTNGTEANAIHDEIKKDTFTVTNIDEKDVKRSPAAPFTTSTLQQECSRKLGFSVKKTMMVAQQMYEGVDVDGKPTALITYMRTDSTNLSDVAIEQANAVISELYGKEYLLPTARKFKSKKGAQEAHEAIRPVDMSIEPFKVKSDLSKDQFNLYELVWKRTVACQMAEAILKQVGADITPDNHKQYNFRATGQTVVFPGFMKVYMEGNDQEEDDEKDGEKLLPLLKKDESVDLKELLPEQHFTKPPARYTEAALVKKLESEGIGRPSTYAPTISTIIARLYVEKDGKVLKPTDLGMLVTDLLVEHFPKIVDYKFTAEMEEGLDKVAEGKQAWVPLIRDFYEPFHKLIVEKNETIKKDDITTESSEEKCPECSNALQIKFGRFGKFYACTNYPECKFKRPLVVKEKTQEQKDLEEKLKGTKCEKCGSDMAVKTSRFGSFLGCTNYPKCKNIVSIDDPNAIKCPKCGKGSMIKRFSKKTRKAFYGCNKYPDCKNAVWDKPTGELCKKCGMLITEKTSKEGDVKLVCSGCADVSGEGTPKEIPTESGAE